MSIDMVYIIIILIMVVILFVTRWIHMDVIPLLIPFTLIVLGLVSGEEVFSGFSSSAVITIASLFVITKGLVRCGVVNKVADILNRLTGKNRIRFMLAGTLLPGVTAGFMIVSATVLFFIPTLLRMSIQNKIPQSQVLLPLVASCLIGGNLTLIGASHNLVVNSLAHKSLGYGFTIFEYLPAGVILLFLVVSYTILVGRHLLPNEPFTMDSLPDNGSDLIQTYRLDDRLWELWVGDQAFACGKSIRQLDFGKRFGLFVVAVVRGDKQMPAEQKELCINSGDILLVLSKEDKAKELADQEGFILVGHPRQQNKFPLSTAELVEVVVPPRSPVIGQTLTEMNFRENTGLSGVALWHKGRPHCTDVGNLALQEGDGLLLFGDRKKTRNYKPKNFFLWLHPPCKDEALPELSKYGPLAVLILVMVVISAAFRWLPIDVAAVIGATSMILCKILEPREIYTSIEWRVIILIGCLYPLGLALHNTGAANYFAEQLLIIGNFNPHLMIAIIGAVCIIITQPLHNVAVALIMTPVAIDVASILGANPKPFLIAVIIGASTAFMMPTGHPVTLLIQKPGGYRAKDFVVFGLGLSLLIWVVIVFIVPMLWPF